MKKMIALALAAVMVLAMAACTAEKPEPTTPVVSTPAATDPVSDPTLPQETTTPSAPSSQDGTATPAQQFYAAFQALMAAGGKDKTCEELAQDLVTAEWVPFMGGSMAVEPGYLNGFAHEVEGFTEGAQFSPMIGAIPFVGFVFRVAEDADVNAFMDTLKTDADMRWNICTQADELLCENEGSTVLFIMAPATFEE